MCYLLLSVPHGDIVRIATPPLQWDDINTELSDSGDTQTVENENISENTCDPNYISQISSEPHFIRQNKLNDFVCDLGL